MNKTIFVLALGMLFVPAVSFAAFDVDLRYGSSGAEVFELQEFLTAEGVYTGPITGNFYSLTLAGVKAFQSREGVQPVSGFFGPLTRAEANKKLAVALEDSDEEAALTPPVVTNDKPRVRTTTNTGGEADDDEEEDVEVFDFDVTVEVTDQVEDGKTKVIFRTNDDVGDNATLKTYDSNGSPRGVSGGFYDEPEERENGADGEFAPGTWTWKVTVTKDGQTVTKEGSFTVE